MSLQIPDSYKNAVESLIRLSDESTDSLVNALSKAAPAISPRALAKSIAPNVSPDVGTLAELLTALISLISWVRPSEKRSAQDLGEQVAALRLRLDLVT